MNHLSEAELWTESRAVRCITRVSELKHSLRAASSQISRDYRCDDVEKYDDKAGIPCTEAVDERAQCTRAESKDRSRAFVSIDARTRVKVQAHDKILVLADNQMKNVLLNCGSLRCDSGTGKILRVRSIS